MRALLGFIIRIMANAVGILIASYFVSGFVFGGSLPKLLMAGFVLALINFIIKPILKFVTGPLIILTMGLFMIIINILLLWVVTLFIPELTIVGFWAYFWSVLIISIINAIAHKSVKKNNNNI